MIWIDRKYSLLLSPRLSLFKQKKSDLFNFRCPFCLDSQKDRTKARGYIFLKKLSYRYICHNCGVSCSLKQLLEHVDLELAKEYSMEVFTEKYGTQRTIIPDTDIIPELPKRLVNKLELPNLLSVPANNIARTYVSNRKIPYKFYNILYYAENFKEFVEAISDKQLGESSHWNNPRLVIPFYDKNKNLICFQGRALDDNKARYVTIKLTDHPKIYGSDRIINTNEIYVVEGPIDSLFIGNCIATADSDLSASSAIYDKSKLILIPDCQPRNKDIIRAVNRFVENDFTVCLLPEVTNAKDINDMILSGIKKSDIQNIIRKHTYYGLELKLQFSKWRKI